MIKRTLQVAALSSMAFGMVVPTNAVALDGGPTGPIARFEPFGSCTATLLSDVAAGGSASVRLLTAGFANIGFAGASQFAAGAPIPAVALTTAGIESCGFLNVSNLVQNGADGTYATDNEIFVRFRATDPGDGLTYDYELALRGVTNTQAIITQVEVVEEPDENGEDGLSAEDIQRPVSEFLQARAAQTLATQPDLTRFLSQTGDANFDVQATRGQGRLSFGSKATGALWTDVQASWSTQDDTDTSYLIGTVGGHVQPSANLLVGLMISADRAEDSQEDADIEGTGWLAGPYLVARLPDQPLYFEGRLLYGETENELEMDADEADFDSTRMLFQTRVTGEILRGQTTLFPHLDFSRITDEQDDFTTDAGIEIDDQKIALSALTLGMDFDQPLEVQTGTLSLIGGVSAIWSETDGDGIPSGSLASGEDTRGRVDLGLDYSLNPNNTVKLETFYDGIGTDDFEGYGMSLNWALDF